MNLTDLAPDILTHRPEVRRLSISGVTADSRLVTPGSLFAALPGSKVKGSQFITEAVRAGAAVVLVGLDEQVPADMPVPVLRDADPQRRFARLVARFYAPQPETVVAVTGTNGKTSVASFVRQIWQTAGRDAASVGTVGVVVKGESRYGNLTTPDPVTLHRTLHDLKAEGIDHVALEASSHGLIQRRLDGLRLKAGAFTNITRDHLDYHGTFEAYMAAKLRLFETVLEDGAAAVINMDDRHAETFAAAARINGLDVRSVGRNGKAIRLVEVERDGFCQIVTVDLGRGPRSVRVPLTGAFQTSNALVAVGLAIATGVAPDDALDAVETLEAPPAGSNSSPRPGRARRCSSTTPIRRTRWKRR
ncbi:UDP-N-acetylmuramoyl-L-alanyl-D-glutamate--L-lysine ligase [Methylobrevis pamukkalensis]|uniref:UDP-N-acetylmuramoyl-L-alanyl-D-glutamate--L-lysine ligase n=1 Tax=Methylobrevis pamukkalensis TaxID=1439726 RepID=A0A1E3H5G5_9HYPH|nr:UDP-N-acetylmuramoyl-L-alanyl-D-glutamate--L-lysine ligase [Methylobrevis pamukkalensis]